MQKSIEFLIHWKQGLGSNLKPQSLMLPSLKAAFWRPFDLQLIYFLMVKLRESCITGLNHFGWYETVFNSTCPHSKFLNKRLWISPRSLWISVSFLALQWVGTEMKPSCQNLVMVSPSRSCNCFHEFHADLLSSSSLCTSVAWQTEQMELLMPEECSAWGAWQAL